eukprot:CAMPEP_0117427312 /NCGR_PEP_ID=MMETSP0758-20121206/7188_1 /TAXON_ID=63605 /ORGANISM="Percolomonas cosmopolitus, Strain AE-1 (ATCC 50343)" /LENGTH=215 /DNA_ID=CAMNT_0005212879 /DNA_START=82 /DNA_END=729 /DNA_ORIENTATION=-
MGIDTTKHCFHDILSFDLLMMIPKPTRAVLLMYPITKENEEFHRKEESEQQKGNEQKEIKSILEKSFFIKQTISNACGTIGILHALSNNVSALNTDDDNKDSFFSQFMKDNAKNSASERATYLEKNNQVAKLHESSAKDGFGDASEHTNTRIHFVCYAEIDDHLVLFDGRRPFPIVKGKIKSGLLEDASADIKSLIQLNQDAWKEFSATAFAASS